MYLFVGCLLILVLILFIFFRCRRKKVCKLICGMTCEEKCDTIYPVIAPFGYCYEPSQDIFSTVTCAPQRAFGYTALFDRYAPHFNMVFDSLPVYFDYDGRTWLIEFWKGQYGINLGCEVGLYKADELVPSILRKTALFESVDDSEMLPMSIRLYRQGHEISHLRARKHWWLTAFHMGAYTNPGDLSVEIAITFPCAEMLSAFTNALEAQGAAAYRVHDLQVRILFCGCPSCEFTGLHRFFCRLAQWQNRILCRLFLWVTKPFQCAIDRLLFLYFYLPPIFRRIFRDKKRRKCHKKSCRKYRRRRKYRK